MEVRLNQNNNDVGTVSLRVGATGPGGSQGAQGTAGTQGLDGAFAGQGVQGAQGILGAQGTIGAIGSVIYDGGTPFTDFSVGLNINCGGVT